MSATDTENHLAVAGSHVDVLKHVCLCALVKALQADNEQGIILVDAFCGHGQYDLSEQESEEYEKGIMRVHGKIETDAAAIPEPVKQYHKIIQDYDSFFQIYPGSPIIGEKLLRPQDEHKLVDLYVEELQGLEKTDFSFVKGDSFHPDAVPFLVDEVSEKQPVILIDPSYVSSEDFYQAKELLIRILQVNPYATVMLSFPLIQGSRYRFGYAKSLKDDLKKLVKIGFYSCSLTVAKEGVQGSGIFIANPPRDFDEYGCNEDTVNWLSATLLKTGRSDYSLDQWMKKIKEAAS